MESSQPSPLSNGNFLSLFQKHFFYSIVPIIIKAVRFSISILPLPLEQLSRSAFLLLFATPPALCYFSYHLIIIAVCTIASILFHSVMRGLEVCERNPNGMKLKSRTSRHLFDHVLFSVFSLPLHRVGRQAPSFSCRVLFNL